MKQRQPNRIIIVWLFFSFHIGHSDLCHWILVVGGSAYAYGEDENRTTAGG